MTSPTGRTSRDQAAGSYAPADERIMPDEERIVPDARATAQGDGMPVPDDQRTVPDDDQIVLDQRFADGDPIALGNGDNAATGGGAGPPGRGTGPGGASPSDRWPEIQAMFVDDPRASVELAVGLMDESAEKLIASVRQRQHALLSAWQGTDAGTEELRNALQGYRTFWNQLDAFVQDA